MPKKKDVCNPEIMSAYCPNPACPKPKNPVEAKFCQACGAELLLAEGYRLISLLGQGGFGRTFLADNPAQNIRRCVVKQLFTRPVSGEVSSDTIAKDTAFNDEAERLRQLGKHPQIPRLLAAIATESSQFLVQEFAPGQNLQQQVEAQGPWDEGEVRSLLNSLVAVLQYVHSFQIIHRDIKPANIVAPSNGGPLRKKGLPMLVDFGSAKWVRRSPAKTVIGSAGYAAPEQSMGQATFASDIYSLGLTCLYLLTGVHPFELYSAVEDRWVWQDYLSTPVDPQFAEVLGQMVARSLQQRYESMDQVAQGLNGSQSLRKTLRTTLRNTAPQQLPQKLLERAKAAVPGLKNLLTPNSSASLTQPGTSRSRSALTAHDAASLEKPAAIAKPTETWKKRYRLAPAKVGLTQTLAVSPDGQRFASGSSDGSLHLWRLADAQLVHTFPRRRLLGVGHRDTVTALSFHPDGRVLYSASADGTIKEWDLNSKQLLNTLPISGWAPTDLAVTPDGTQLIGANSDGKIVIWNIKSLLPVAQLTQHQQCVNQIAVSTAMHQTLLVSASDDGTVKLWQPDSSTQKPSFQLVKTIGLRRVTLGQAAGKKETLKDARAIALTLSSNPSDNHDLIIATSTGAVLLYTLNRYLDVSGPLLFHQSSQPITALASSNDGHLAIGTDDRVLPLWELETVEGVAELSHDWGLSAIAFTPNSQTLITASADEVISIWQRSR